MAGAELIPDVDFKLQNGISSWLSRLLYSMSWNTFLPPTIYVGIITQGKQKRFKQELKLSGWNWADWKFCSSTISSTPDKSIKYFLPILTLLSYNMFCNHKKGYS